MKPYLPAKLSKLELKGWSITDCAVRDRNIMYLCLRKDMAEEELSLKSDSDIPTKLFALYLHRPESPYTARVLHDFNRPRLGVALAPRAQALVASRDDDGTVNVMGVGDPPMEQINAGSVPMTFRLKTVDGQVWSVGGARQIYRRADEGTWVAINEGLPKTGGDTAEGFDDLDAFGPDDMYAVGGHGDVWHFDGMQWKQMGFPSNVRLATVTCAGDGNVYISGEGGSLWVGQKSTWKRLYKGASSVLWNDVLWFDGKLWLASDYQLRVWDGRDLAPVMSGGEVVPIYGHMDARDGLLMVASPQTAMAFDGQAWRTLVAPSGG